MSQAGYTPIRLYYSSTPTAQPLAANLAPGELAVNTADGKLFFKNSSGVIATLADSSSATGNLPGGTAGSLVYQSATGVTAYLGIGTTDFILTSNGSLPVYTNPASITVGTAASATFATNAGTAATATNATTATNLAGGTAGQLAYQSGANTTAFATAPTGSDVGKVLSWNGSSFTWASAPAATSTTNIAGGAQYRIPFQSGVGATTFSANLNFNSSTNTLISTNVSATSALTGDTVVGLGASFTNGLNAGVHSYGTLSYTDVNIGNSVSASINGYVQNIIQNKSGTANASADYVVSNDLGTATTYYGNFGINSSTATGAGSFHLPNAVYLYGISGDVVIGTQSANYLRLVTNDNAADSITINPSSAVAFNGDYGVADQILTSVGNVGAPVWKTPAAITIGTATNLAGGVAGAVPYQSAPNTTAFSAAGSVGQFLVSNGTSAPTWQTLVVADNSLLWYFMG